MLFFLAIEAVEQKQIPIIFFLTFWEAKVNSRSRSDIKVKHVIYKKHGRDSCLLRVNALVFTSEWRLQMAASTCSYSGLAPGNDFTITGLS